MRKLKNEELERLSVEGFKSAAKIPVVIVLDNVRSHLNVGSVFRTADAFKIEAIYLCGITGLPPHRDIQKTALGATETVTWHHSETTLEAVEKLKAQGYTICAIEQAEQAVMLQNFDALAHAPVALVFGNEVDGVAQEVVSISDVVIEIPQFGTKHSLNISVSAGMVIWEVARQLMFGNQH